MREPLGGIQDGAPPPPPPPSWCDKILLKELDPRMRSSYMWFAGALALLLGTQGMIQPPTTSTFINSVGYPKIPVAQTWLPVVYLPILFLYNFLFNTFKNTPVVMVTIMCILYVVLYGVITVNMFMVFDWKNGTEGVLSPNMAWTFYFATNTKSVLFPVMFWSVMNDISARKTPDTQIPFSKIAYGTLVLAGQTGGIIGTTLAGSNQHLGGTPMLLVVQTIALLIVPFFVLKGFQCSTASRVALAIVEEEDRTVEAAAPARGGGAAAGCRVVGKNLWLLVDGLFAIAMHPVLLGIFWIAAAHLIPRVILDYQGTGVINWKWPAHHGCKTHECQVNKQTQTSFFAWCGLSYNIGTMALSYLGLRAIIDKGGLALGLIGTPLISLVSILAVCFCGTEETETRFWVVQIMLAFVNIFQYALNGPCRDMLYVRCTKDVKYKAKSWSDMYGNIMQKTVAAQINLHVNTPDFQPVWSGAYVTGWCSVWICIAVGLGFYHSKLEKEDWIVGKDGVGKWPCLQDKAPSEARDMSLADRRL